MIDVRVDAPVGDEAEQMDVGPAPLRTLESSDESRIREERVVGDRAVHTLEVLIEDSSRADRQVADL